MSDRRGSKQTGRLAVRVDGSGAQTFVPYGLLTGGQPGSRVAIVAGIHGTELVTQDAVQALWQRLDPAVFRGSLTVVFVADILAAQAGVPGANPIDGRNLNRVWPGSTSGTFSERLTAQIWSELLGETEIVIDVHGGEWTEEVVPFAIVHSSGNDELDGRTHALAKRMGLPFVQTTAGEGTLSGAIARSGRVGLAFEVGGGGRRPKTDVEEVVAALMGVLGAIGSIDEAEGATRRATEDLFGGDQLRTAVAGVLVQQVELGQKVDAGQTVSLITDFDGEPLEEITAPRAGTVLLRGIGRVVAEGALTATIGWNG